MSVGRGPRMIRVDLHAMGLVVDEAAVRAGKTWIPTYAESGERRSLVVSSGTDDTATVTLTTLEAGTLFWEMSGCLTDWRVRDEAELGQMQDEVRQMMAAVFAGSVSGRCTLIASDRRFRLARAGGPMTWLRHRRRPFAEYPDRP